MLEEALLDVAPDEALDMLKRRSMHKWDARKKKSSSSKAPARPVKDEVRNAAQIAKQRREKRDLALKNLPKAKRRALTHKK